MANYIDINFFQLSNRCKEKGCAIDSSSIIYLDKINLASIFSDSFKVITIRPVISEILNNTDKRINDEHLIESIIIIDNFDEEKIGKIKNKLFDGKIKKISNKLSAVDESLLLFSICEDYPIFTEDKFLIKLADSISFSYYNSLVAILLLLYEGLISKNLAISSFLKLNSIGRYSESVFRFALKYLEKFIKEN